MNDIIKLPENATADDFAAFVNSDEVCWIGSTTDSGKRYIEAAPGTHSVGQTAVRFVRADDPNYTGRRGSAPWYGWRKEIVGTISGVGVAFVRNGIAGDPNAVECQRFYIEG